MEQANNPHYLKASNDHKTNNKFSNTVIDEFDGVYEELYLAVPLKIPGECIIDQYDLMLGMCEQSEIQTFFDF
jgi:hypothetical protein